ncbi:MAG TPA: efflux RND transporter periplasmic adaptor subunit [Acidisarcina sp.]|nr:efflux RND transporter periplasmic adaptor subunit [Acidisarcina sp.]
MYKRSFPLFIGMAALLPWMSLLLAGCKDAESHPKAAEIPSALVTRVVRDNLASTLTVAGQFQPFQEVDLHAKVSGYIRRIGVDIGDRVRTGQVIATLEVPELTAQVAGAQASVQHNESEIARAKSEVLGAESNHVALHAAYMRLEQASKSRPGLIAEQELDDARARDLDSEAKISIAKSALEASEGNLGVARADRQRIQALSAYSVITAPFSGVITMRYADTGSLIQSGTTSNTQAMPVVRLAQSDMLRLRMPIPESDVPYIQDGDEVQIQVQATGKTFPGKIVRFTRSLDTSTRTMLAEVDVPNPDLKLSPGMYAQVVIALQQRDNVLTIPTQAIVQSEGQPYVLVIDASDTVRKRLVTLGIEGPDKSEVISGVAAGDQVIVSGQTNYQVGEIVRPKMTRLMTTPKQGGN